MLVIEALKDDKVTAHEAREIAVKSLVDVQSFLESRAVNHTGAKAGPTPKGEVAEGNEYDQYMSLKSEGKHAEAQAYYVANSDKIIKNKRS